MAPPTKITKPGKNDIRLFFGGNSKKLESTPTSSSGLKRQHPIQISDEEDKSLKKAPKNNHIEASESQSAKRTVISDDDSESYNKIPRASLGKRRKISTRISSDDDDSNDLGEDEISPPKKSKNQVTRKRAASPTIPSTPKSRDPPTSKPEPKSKPKPRPLGGKQRLKKGEDDFIVDSNHEESSVSEGFSSDIEEMPVSKPRPAKPKTQTKRNDTSEKPQKKKGKVDTIQEPQAQAPESSKAKSFNWAAAKAAKLAGPVAHGSKQVPDGTPDCLAGLSFVFTGELSSFARDEAIDLAKRFGGRVVGQPSSKTNYVVLGDNAGPSKLNAIKKHGLKTLTEDEFLELIATRKGGAVDDKTKKKMEKETEGIRLAAIEMEKKEEKEAGSSMKVIDPSSQLWTTRYAPQSLKEICGNKGQVEKLQLWLHDWSTSLKANFKKPGKNGMNIYRAVLITGPPGIGKTTSAHLCAKLEGFTPIEFNASDTRSKKLVENGMNINNKSLDGYVLGSQELNSAGIAITDKTCLIMDEVDGMSAGDRGGVGALNAMIKKSKIPIICIANDRQAQKLKPLMSTTFSLSFQKPQAAAIRSRLMTIIFKEKMKIPANVLDQLVAGAQSDIRQVLNMLSTWKLSSNTMDFDQGKNLAKMNEKYSIMSPFDITSKMLGPYLFSATSRETLGEKMELYFQDHSFMPLFIQENYLKTQPAKIRDLEGPEKVLKQLELMDRAASSISDGDLVDALIHGPEQHWGLMPLHAVCSTVRPSSLLYGMGAHYGGPNSLSFPGWLGQNSKQSKLSRQLSDVQIRMRLKVSGDKFEIRQSYIPALSPYIVRPLVDNGTSSVDEVIERMDEYYLSKEDWDTVVELGVDEQKDDLVLKKISPATKTALTRKYNASEHPIPFHKAQDLGKAPKKLAAELAPDLEEAFDMDDAVEDISDEENKKNPDDIGGDKLIQVAKKKKKAPTKAKTPSAER